MGDVQINRVYELLEILQYSKSKKKSFLSGNKRQLYLVLRVVEGYGVVSAECVVYIDVHAWRVSYVVGGCNVIAAEHSHVNPCDFCFP